MSNSDSTVGDPPGTHWRWVHGGSPVGPSGSAPHRDVFGDLKLVTFDLVVKCMSE